MFLLARTSATTCCCDRRRRQVPRMCYQCSGVADHRAAPVCRSASTGRLESQVTLDRRAPLLYLFRALAAVRPCRPPHILRSIRAQAYIWPPCDLSRKHRGLSVQGPRGLGRKAASTVTIATRGFWQTGTVPVQFWLLGELLQPCPDWLLARTGTSTRSAVES